MDSVINPRFPHTVKILRVDRDEDGNEIYDEETGETLTKVVLESECGLRDLVRGTDVDIEVLKADYKLALPRTPIVVKFRDQVVFTHSYTGEKIEGEVEAYKTFNLGTNIWFQSNGNKHG